MDRDGVDELLVACGADRIPHPGGTLLAHLRRVAALLAEWEARPELVTAGLCHAFYGTDGFGTALLELSDRGRLAAVAGVESERIVYRYASCDRAVCYPRLAAGDPAFRDRFTGTEVTLDAGGRRDVAELTAANELDLARVNPEFRAAHGGWLLGLLTDLRPLLSDACWRETTTLLA